MSEITAAPRSNPIAKPPTAVSVDDHPLIQLTLVRFREFLREPEAVFWVFIFPILLAAGLGIAFRNRPGVSSSNVTFSKTRVCLEFRHARLLGYIVCC